MYEHLKRRIKIQENEHWNIFTLPAWQKTLARKTEKENKKIANTESSLVYNTTCLKENLLPTYTITYVYISIYTYIYHIISVLLLSSFC